MTTARIITLADEVVDLLNDEDVASTFPVSFDAQRAWRVRRQDAQLDHMGVYVIPSEISSEPLDRSSWQEEPSVTIVVQQAVEGPDALPQIDLLWLLVERIADHLRTAGPLGGFGSCIDVEMGTLDTPQLDGQEVFTAAIIATWRTSVSAPVPPIEEPED